MLKEQKKFAEVEVELTAFSKREPIGGSLKLGRFLRDQERFAEAGTSFREAVRLQPNASNVSELADVWWKTYGPSPVFAADSAEAKLLSQRTI